MTEEKIIELQDLLFYKEKYSKIIEGLQNVLGCNPNYIFFDVFLRTGDKPNFVEEMEDRDGLLIDAVKKIKEKYEADLAGIQKKIDEF